MTINGLLYIYNLYILFRYNVLGPFLNHVIFKTVLFQRRYKGVPMYRVTAVSRTVITTVSHFTKTQNY